MMISVKTPSGATLLGPFASKEGKIGKFKTEYLRPEGSCLPRNHEWLADFIEFNSLIL